MIVLTYASFSCRLKKGGNQVNVNNSSNRRYCCMASSMLHFLTNICKLCYARTCCCIYVLLSVSSVQLRPSFNDYGTFVHTVIRRSCHEKAPCFVSANNKHGEKKKEQVLSRYNTSFAFFIPTISHGY